MMSSAFPCGTPSTTSNITTSPRFFKPASKARVPPIWPAPIRAIFLRAMGNSSFSGAGAAPNAGAGWRGSYRELPDRTRRAAKLSRLVGNRPFGLPAVANIHDLDAAAFLPIDHDVGRNDEPSRSGE